MSVWGSWNPLLMRFFPNLPMDLIICSNYQSKWILLEKCKVSGMIVNGHITKGFMVLDQFNLFIYEQMIRP